METIKYSTIIPIYRNQESLPRLLAALSELNRSLGGQMEAVFVVDGSPDHSFENLKERLDSLNFPAQLLGHSRNFGSFPAIRTGLKAARGKYFGVMAADLQEPPELLLSFFKALSQDDCDVAVGTRVGRNDPWHSKVASSLFWKLYRQLVVPEMPEGGVDIFGCNQIFRDQLLQLEESRSSLVALIYWLGFRRKQFDYERLERKEGQSGWTFRKKFDYMMDSIFAFTDFPIRLLIRIGAFGIFISVLVGVSVLSASLAGQIQVPGYAAIMLTMLFLGAVNIFALGLIGNYAWRAYENSKKRPLALVAAKIINNVI